MSIDQQIWLRRHRTPILIGSLVLLYLALGPLVFLGVAGVYCYWLTRKKTP